MKVNLSGAGSGKTTKVAEMLFEKYNVLTNNKIIFCVCFTNNAERVIRERYISKYGSLPSNIKISTIHSFLYSELIRPYNSLLYKENVYRNITKIPLHEKPQYRNSTLKRLRENNTLHVSEFTQVAKYVLLDKSSDKKAIKELRAKICNTFKMYCDTIIVDEAQDIDTNFAEILKKIDDINVEVNLIGDIKQNLKSEKGMAKILSELNSSEHTINTFDECYRCPPNILKLSNLYCDDNEKQVYKNIGEIDGNIKLVFESDINVREYIDENNFDLKYIFRKNKTFNTQKNLDIEMMFLDTIKDILIDEFRELKNNYEIDKIVFFKAHLFLESMNIDKKTVKQALTVILEKEPKSSSTAKMLDILKRCNVTKEENIISVDSIQKVKGDEGSKCLYILDKSLADYFLLRKKNRNKMFCHNYVALTRTKNELVILVTSEAEKTYSKQIFTSFLDENNITYTMD